MKYIALTGYYYYPLGAEDIVGVYNTEAECLEACIAHIQGVYNGEHTKAMATLYPIERAEYNNRFIEAYNIETKEIRTWRYTDGIWQ